MISIGAYTPSTGNAVPGTAAALGVRVSGRVGAPSAAREVDLCASAAAARARGNPAAPGLQAQCDAARAAGASTLRTVGGCAEPATYKNAMGMTRYVDVEAGKRYTQCLQDENEAKEKAYFDLVVARRAGGPDGCGPDVQAIRDSGSAYTGKALRNAWAACRGPVPGVPQAEPNTPSSPQKSPPIVPGSPQVVPSGLVSSSEPSPQVHATLDLQRFAPGGAAFPSSDPGGAAPPLSLQQATFGAGGHVEAPGWAWVAGGVVVLGIGALFLRSKGVL